MLAGLERFVVELRRSGLEVSPAEWLDAIRAAEAVGLTHRGRFRAALRCALVKQVRHRQTFDEIFARFFSSPRRGGAGRKPDGAPGISDGRSNAGSGSGQVRPGRPNARSRERPTDDEPPRSPRDRSVAALVDRVRDGRSRRDRRLRRVVCGPLESKTQRSEPSRRGDLEPHDPLRRDLHGRMTTEEERELARRVTRIVERIRRRRGLRQRRSARGGLVLRRLFRENLACGGVPFLLPRQRRALRRSRIVLLLDVSWSTARAAGLFLAMATELIRRARDARVLLFVDRAVDGTEDVRRWLASPVGDSASRTGRGPAAGIARGDVSFADVLHALGELNLDAPSDYGRAFHGLLRSPLRPSGRHTVLVVLGDGRTNRFDPQDWSFEEVAARCGSVLWLVPEALEQWGTGDSALAAYLPHVDVAVEARDLLGLERGVAELAHRVRG